MGPSSIARYKTVDDYDVEENKLFFSEGCTVIPVKPDLFQLPERSILFVVFSRPYH